MKCNVCNSGKLEVVNSRKHPSSPSVWRRRECSNCQLIFTTKELPDYDRALKIAYGKRKKDLIAFNKIALLTKLFASGGHLQKQDDLFWLAETIASKSFKTAAANGFIISGSDYRSIVLETLQAYDMLLSANFEARNPSS